MALLDTLKNLVSPGTSNAPKVGADYMRGNKGVVFSGWRPQLRKANDEIANAWDVGTARTIDLIQNSGWIAGGIDQAATNTVGTGLRLKAQPDLALFNDDALAAAEWVRLVERAFDHWASDPLECDIEGRRNFGQMQYAQFKTWLATGEILGEVLYRKRPYIQYGSKVRIVHPYRLSRKTEPLENIVLGVKQDADGFPIGYMAKRDDPYLGETDIFVPARDSMGRPRVIHVFDGPPGATRGVSPMLPALYVAKQFDQLADATLMASIVQAVFAASVTSDAPTEEAMAGLLTPAEQAKMATSGQSTFDAWFEMQAGWYDEATMDVGINGRVVHMFPGQELKFHSADHPQSQYKDFSQHLLREIARCIGMTYESMTGDYEGATYSSVRMATGEIFKITEGRRKHIIAPFCQCVYTAWLEEAIELGKVPFPGGSANFLENRNAASRAAWRGSPKPQADDLKAAKAHEVWSNMGVISHEMIANDLGVDIEDVYAARAREKDMRELYDLDEPMANNFMQAPGGEDNEQDDSDDQSDE